MKFNAVHDYQHPADEVFDALVHIEAITAKHEAIGQNDVQLVRCDEDDDGSITMVTTRVVPLELPGFAKKVLSPKQHVTQTDVWSGAMTEYLESSWAVRRAPHRWAEFAH